MDKNHVLTNALFRKKMAELTGKDIAQTPHFNDFQALDGSTFKTEMDKLIANPPWSGGGSDPSDSDIFTIIFDLAGDVPGEERMTFTARCEYEDIFTAQKDGKKIQAFIGMGEADSGNGILAMPQEIGDTRSDFSSYLIAFENEGQMVGIIVTVIWDTEEAEYPITGTMSMVPLSGGGGSSELYYKANVVVDLSTGNFSVAPIGDSFTYDIIHDAVDNGTPVRVIVEIKDSDGGSTADSLLELHYTSEDLTGSANTITFEKSVVDLTSNKIRFNRLWCTKSGNDTLWYFDQTNITISTN